MIIEMANLGNYYVPDGVKGGICVDIGANVGNFFKKYNTFFSLIHFYEPYKECFDICNNQKFINVHGFNEAVTDKKSFTKIVNHFNGESGSNALLDAPINEHWNKSNPLQEVKTVDLEEVLQRVGGKIDYLKCDAETSEYLIFLNKDLSNIKYLSLELHWQMGKEKYDELINYLLLAFKSEGDFMWTFEQNKECLFINKKSNV